MIHWSNSCEITNVHVASLMFFDHNKCEVGEAHDLGGFQHGCISLFLYWLNFTKKKKKKIEFEGFQLSKVRKNSKNCQFFIFGFQCVTIVD